METNMTTDMKPEVTADVTADVKSDVTTDVRAFEGGAESVERRRGIQSIVAALTAIAGLVVAMKPHNPVAEAVSRTLPVVGDAVPAIVAAIATVVAAFSSPPR